MRIENRNKIILYRKKEELKYILDIYDDGIVLFEMWIIAALLIVDTSHKSLIPRLL